MGSRIRFGSTTFLSLHPADKRISLLFTITIDDPFQVQFMAPEAHSHASAATACPFAHSGKPSPHGWCPAQATDSRSPCPAINSMANHGYISRDGRSISTWQLIRALKRVYALTWPFATFLVVVGLIIIGHYNLFRGVDLIELARHGRVEHNASLVHDDALTEAADADGEKKIIMAPTNVNQDLVEQMFSDPLLYANCTPSFDNDHDVTPSSEPSSAGSDTTLDGASSSGSLTASVADEDMFARKQAEFETDLCIPTMDFADLARHRVRRQAECGPTGKIHQEIARGEMAIILNAWGVDRLGKLPLPTPSTRPKLGAPVSWLREWLGSERLPEEWFDSLESGAERRVTGLMDTVKMSKSIKLRAEQIVADAAAAANKESK